jgi:hypothetical protein
VGISDAFQETALISRSALDPVSQETHERARSEDITRITPAKSA